MLVAKRRLVASLAGAVVLILAVAAFRLLPPTYPTGDRAFLELYALHATDGNLTVGLYSRVGWNHPGPVYLYALAPLHALSGQREFSLDSTALLINLASLAALIAVVSTAGDAYLGWSLIAALTIFLFRPGPARDIGELLASSWNPHVVTLPFGLLIGLCAALAVGRVRVLPAVALVGSFVVQTHIGLLPCTMALVAMAVALWMYRRRVCRSAPVGVPVGVDTPRGASIRPWVLASVGLFALLWMLPLVDQVVGSGNAGEIVRFFLSDDRPRPSPSTSFAAAAYGLFAAVRLQGRLAVGNVVISATDLGPLPAIWLVLQVMLLAIVWRWAVRQGRSFHAAFCLLCLVTTVVAVWSAFNIHGMVRDYLVFWMSILGVANLSALGGALAWWAARALRRRGIAMPARIGPAVVTTERRPSGGSVVVPLPDLSGLAGFPPAVVLRLENRDRVATTVRVSINDAELARVVLPPERTVRVDLNMSAGAGSALSREVPSETLSALISDLGIVWLHIVLPEVMTEKLPTIVGDWRGFAKNRFRQRNERSAEFDRFLATIGESKESRFYFLHTMYPHMPFTYVPSGRRYAAPDYQGTLEQGERLFERASAGFADAVHQRHLLQVGFVDQLLGRLLDRLKEQRIYDEALIIITADHGASYREGMHRRNFRKENAADIILIPLIVKVPGQESGIISDRPVETVDILPTIASVLSIDTPFGVDGQSLIDFDLPEKESRTFIRRNSSRIRPTEVEDLADLAELSLKRKVDRFGTGTDEELYSVRGTASLLGVDVSEYADPRGSDVRVRVNSPNQFKVIDLTQEPWPLYVRGTVEAGGLQPVGLAVAMNGRVAATTESYMEGGEWVFATVLPEEYLRHGTNDLQVFLIDDNAGSLVLRSTSSRRRDRDRRRRAP